MTPKERDLLKTRGKKSIYKSLDLVITGEEERHGSFNGYSGHDFDRLGGCQNQN